MAKIDELLETIDTLTVVELAENYEVLMNAIIKAKPPAAKGQYIKGVSISTTMGHGLHINKK